MWQINLKEISEVIVFLRLRMTLLLKDFENIMTVWVIVQDNNMSSLPGFLFYVRNVE